MGFFSHNNNNQSLMILATGAAMFATLALQQAPKLGDSIARLFESSSGIYSTDTSAGVSPLYVATQYPLSVDRTKSIDILIFESGNYGNTANRLIERNDERAAEFIEKTRRMRPSDYSLVRSSLFLNNRLGNYEEAINDLTELITAQPDMVSPLEKVSYMRERATAYLQLGKHNEASLDMGAVLNSGGGLGVDYYLMGLSLAGLGRFEDAISYLKKSNEAEPTFPESFGALVYCYGAIGENEKAAGFYNRAWGLFPADRNSLDHMLRKGKEEYKAKNPK
jgi:tetratricopeptide (TPR) repeat protein